MQLWMLANGFARCSNRRFAPVAEQWFRQLLTDAAGQPHGLDLFGRDALVLGEPA
jgi:hypothetical protein